MSYSYGYGYSGVVAGAQSSDRALFIRRTYAHLAGAVLAFVALETFLVMQFPPVEVFKLLAFSPYSWLLVLGAFWLASWIAQVWARSETSSALQYCGLGLYIVAVSVVFLPLLSYVSHYVDGPNPHKLLGIIPPVIGTAGILTLAVFGGLTLSVFITRKDYSFLRPILCVGSLIAFGVIVAGIFFGFGLGLLFSFAMVALMSGYILYYTSNVMLHYRTTQHVAAALALFASVATLFYYILRILLILNRSR